MADEFEYLDVETITIPLEDGSDMECAVMDEFEMNGQGYIVLAPVQGDEIGEDLFVYREETDGEDTILSYIDDEEELAAVQEFYDELLAELDDEE